MYRSSSWIILCFILRQVVVIRATPKIQRDRPIVKNGTRFSPINHPETPPCPDAPSRFAFVRPYARPGEEVTRVTTRFKGNSGVTYRLSENSGSRLFSIDPASGSITTVRGNLGASLLAPQKLSIVASSGNKACLIKILVQAATVKKERAFLAAPIRSELPVVESNVVPPVPSPDTRQNVQSSGQLTSSSPYQPYQIFTDFPFSETTPAPFSASETSAWESIPENYDHPLARQQGYIPIQTSAGYPSNANPASVSGQGQAAGSFSNQLQSQSSLAFGQPSSGNAAQFSGQFQALPNQNPLGATQSLLASSSAGFGSSGSVTPGGASPGVFQRFPDLVSVGGYPAIPNPAPNPTPGPSVTPSPQSSPPGIIPQYPVLPNSGGYPAVPPPSSASPPGGSNGTLSRPPPVCSQPLYTGIVSETAPIGTFVVRAIATGDRIQWTISDTAFERFSVNPTTGEVSVAGTLKRRTRAAMEFKLRATDAYGLWCDAVVRINVVTESPGTPSNYPPYFTQYQYFFTIQCGPSGQRVGSVIASDTDVGQTVTYQVIGTNEFSVDANGNIQTTGAIQSTTQRTFSLVAVDNGYPSQTATATVVVTVSGSCGQTTSSNTPPTFSQSSYILSASCRVNGVFVGMLTARDYESSTVRYSVTGTSEFVINPTTGELRAQGSLNNSTPRMFNVVANDNGSPPMSAAVPVTVNVINCSPVNNPPSFAQSSYQFTVPCATVVGTTIGSTQAYDGENNQITYSLSGTQQQYGINPNSGLITLNSPLQNLGLQQYNAIATDNGQPPMSSTAPVTVIVNGNCGPTGIQTPPTLPPVYTYPPVITPPGYPPAVPTPPVFQQASFFGSIPCLTQTGSLIGSFPVFYSAGQQYLSYTLSGTSDFSVNNVGEVRNAALLPSSASRTFIIIAVDTRYPSQSATAQITISMGPCASPPGSSTPGPPLTPPPLLPPVFSQAQYVTTVACIGAPGFTIGTITAQYSALERLTYTLAGTKFLSDSMLVTHVFSDKTDEFSVVPAAFTMDNSGRLINTVPLNGAVIPAYSFTVLTADSSNPSLSATSTIIVNVQPCSTTPAPPALTTPTPSPVFPRPSYVANVTCLASSGFLIGAITAQYSRPLTYSLVNTNAFVVDSFGQVTNSISLDGRLVPFYSFVVIARDTSNPSLTATAQVTVNVSPCSAPTAPPTTTTPFVFPTPAPTQPPAVTLPTQTTFAFFPPTTVTIPPVQRPPQFSQQQYIFSMACQDRPGIFVGTVTVQYGQQLIMSLSNTNSFSVDNFGQISTQVPVNGALVPSYTFIVTAADARNPSLVAQAQVTVSVAPCSFTTPAPFLTTTTPRPVPPQFLQAQYSFSVPCLNSIGNPVGSVTVQYSQPQQLSYTLTGTSSFGVDNFGQITNSVILNGAVQPLYPFLIVVIDSRNPALSATAQVTVNVASCATPAPPPVTTTSSPPVFPRPQYSANTSCLPSPGFLIGTITAQFSQSLTYTLINTNAFAVDNFGQITNIIPLNGATVPAYSFSIIATGPGGAGSSQTASAQVTIFVSPCPTSPSPPVTFASPPPVTFPTFAPSPVTFPTFAPSPVTFPTFAPPAVIFPTFAPPPPVTFPTFAPPSATFPTLAPPPATPPPQPPVFPQSQYMTSIQCQPFPGFSVGSVSAQYSRPQQLVYTLVGTNAFTVDNSGTISNTVALNGVVVPTYQFTVIVRVSDSPGLTASALVTVNVAPCPTAPPVTAPPARPPVFSQPVYFFVTQCSNNISPQIGTVQAVDAQGGQVIYSLLIPSQDLSLDNVRGTVGSARPLSVIGFYNATVVAAATSNPSLSSTATVQVQVVGPCPGVPPTSAPPAVVVTQPPFIITPPTIPPTFATVPTTTPPPPRFSQNFYTFTYSCTAGTSQIIGVTQASGTDVSYTIEGSNNFIISFAGEIRFMGIAQGPQTLSFLVVALDDFNQRATAQVQVSIPACATPAPPATTTAPPAIFTTPPTAPPIFTAPPTFPPPQQPPQFPQNSYSFILNCPNSPNILVGTVTALYPSPQGLRYTLTGSSEFSVDNRGELRSTVFLSSGQRFFQITVADGTNSAFASSVQVSVNVIACVTRPPTLAPFTSAPLTQIPFTPAPPAQLIQVITFSQQSYSFLVTCPLTPNQQVGQVQASSSSGEAVRYALTGTNSFTISSGGQIQTVGTLQGPLVLPFQVIATDSTGNSGSVQIQVSVPSCVTQPPPQLPSFPQQSYVINVGCPNSPNILIGTVTAQSSQGTNLIYTLGRTNEFSVDNFGEIRSVLLLSASSVHTFTISASDQRNPSLSTTAQVTVNVGPCGAPPGTPAPVTFPTPQSPNQTPSSNSPPYFTNAVYTFTVVCNSQPGTAIGLVYAVDDSSRVQYSTQSTSFSVNPSTGEVLTSSTVSSSSAASFVVTASDSQGLTGSATVSISVTGCGNQVPNSPVITGSTVVTISNCDSTLNQVVSGTPLGYVGATTSAVSNGPVGGLQFSITNDRRFDINPSTGQYYAATNLDTGSYTFSVQVMEGRQSQLSTTATYTVIVDCASVPYRPCNPAYVEAAISEGAPVGTTVITLAGGTSYTNSRPYSAPYSTSSTSYYNNFPAYYPQQNAIPTDPLYSVPPTAYYGGYPATPSPLAQPNMAVVAGGANRGYRDFADVKYNWKKLALRDRRQVPLLSPGQGGAVTSGWTVQKASVPGQYRVDLASGRVTLAQPLDRERVDSYMLKIRNYNGNQNCLMKVGIEVLDVNDNAPVFSNQSYFFTAPCGQTNAVVGAITARDFDSGLRGFVSYSILNSDNSIFGIDCYTGEVRLRRTVTPGILPQTLTIQAENPTSPSRSTTTTMTVSPGAGCF